MVLWTWQSGQPNLLLIFSAYKTERTRRQPPRLDRTQNFHDVREHPIVPIEKLIRSAVKGYRSRQAEYLGETQVGRDAEEAARLAPIPDSMPVQQSAERSLATDYLIAQFLIEGSEHDFDRPVFDRLSAFRTEQHHFAAVVIRSLITLENVERHFLREILLKLARHVASVDQQPMCCRRERSRIDEIKFRKGMGCRIVKQRQRMK